MLFVSGRFKEVIEKKVVVKPRIRCPCEEDIINYAYGEPIDKGKELHIEQCVFCLKKLRMWKETVEENRERLKKLKELDQLDK